MMSGNKQKAMRDQLSMLTDSVSQIDSMRQRTEHAFDRIDQHSCDIEELKKGISVHLSQHNQVSEMVVIDCVKSVARIELALMAEGISLEVDDRQVDSIQPTGKGVDNANEVSGEMERLDLSILAAFKMIHEHGARLERLEKWSHSHLRDVGDMYWIHPKARRAFPLPDHGDTEKPTGWTRRIDEDAFHNGFAKSVCDGIEKIKAEEKLPITEEWLLGVGFKVTQLGSPGRWLEIGAIVIISRDEATTRWKTRSQGLSRNIETRRDVRLLCELLRIELKEET